jgi:Ca-activated chloride channel family protein
MRRTGLTGALALAMIFSRADFDRAQTAPASQEAHASTAPGTHSVTIPPGQKFILQLETAIHTRTTKKGDRVEFSTAAPVMIDNHVLIPNGSWVRGTVTKAKRAGRLFGRAEVNLRFDEIKLADGSQVPLKATITRIGFSQMGPRKEGDPSIKGEAGSGGDLKGAVEAGAQGALIGVMMGGARGAAYGAAAAAAISIAGTMLRRGPDVDLPKDTMFEARFDGPVQIAAAAAQQAAQQEAEQEARADREAAEAHASAKVVSRDTTDTDLPERPRPVLKRQTDGVPEEKTGESRPMEATPPETTPPEATPPEAAPKTEPALATPPTRRSGPPLPAPPPPSSTTVEGGSVKLAVNVRMVLVDTVVRDRAGRMLENLSRGDFRVYEDGVEQDIQSFSRDELPLAVALVIDRSGSVAPYIAELRRIAVRALQQLKPADEVALFSFASSVDRLVDLTKDRRRIAEAIDRVFAGGGTDIIDALHEATTHLAKTAPEQRHAIILVSDNQATVRPQVSEGETIRTAMETETVVYSIKTAGTGTPIGMRIPNLMFGAGSVAKVTEETGGEIIDARNINSLDAALNSVISRLRMRYAIGYYPSNPELGAFHSIQVRLAERLGKPGTDYFIHSRRGYYATAPKPVSR